MAWDRSDVERYCSALEAAARFERSVCNLERAAAYIKVAIEEYASRGAHGGLSSLDPARDQRLCELVLQHLQVLRTIGDVPRYQSAVSAVPAWLRQRAEAEKGPLRAHAKPRVQLPSTLQLRSVFGRDGDRRRVQALLARHRIACIWGMAGMGKSQLAGAVARAMLPCFPDGSVVVDLVTARTDWQLLAEVARQLGVQPHGRPLHHAIADFLRDRRTLLVLDTVEQIGDAAVELAYFLTHECRDSSVLLASQRKLELSDDTTSVPVQLLPLTVPDAGVTSIEKLDATSAVQAFIYHAQVRDPHLALTPETAPAVAQICRELEGIPLSLYLAACQLPDFGLAELAHAVSQRLATLRHGVPNPQRHASLQATLDVAASRLLRNEQILLRRLSVFRGSWSRGFAEFVCAGGSLPADQVVAGLRALERVGLVQRLGTGPSTRWTTFDTVREYGNQRLREADEAWTARNRLGRMVLSLAEQAAEHYHDGAQAEWFARLDAEQSHVRAALSFWLSAPGGAGPSLRLAHNLRAYWYARGNLTEGRQWLEQVLARYGCRRPVRLRGSVLAGLAALAAAQGDRGEAVRLFQESLAIARRWGDPVEIAATAADLAAESSYKDDPEPIRAALIESLKVVQAAGAAYETRVLLGLVGGVELDQGNLDGAKFYLSEALSLARDAGDLHAVATTLTALADLRIAQGDATGARAAAGESLELMVNLGSSHGVAYSRLALGRAEECAGNHDEALGLCRQGLREVISSQDEGPVASVIVRIAALLAAKRMLDTAIRLLGFAAKWQDERGLPVSAGAFRKLEETEARIRGTVDPVSFGRLWDAGYALPDHEGLSLATSATP